MKQLKVKGNTGSSAILIGEKLERADNYLPVRNPVIITDANVSNLYKDAFPPGQVITIGCGESIKTLDTVREIFDQLVAFEADRSTFIMGIGGGIVCDITGFVASTYMRGVRFGFAATTLLSQVDASVGGKNGVNFKGYKNMVGVFNQPEFVICDPRLLKTLPEDEILSGFAEIVKHAAIADAGMFSYLEENRRQALDLDPAVVEKLLVDSITIKADVVKKDEKETGERRKLNFGHTFGHAIEKTHGLLHGHAVSIGMVLASALSSRRGLLPDSDAQKIRRLLDNLGLPTHGTFDLAGVIEALGKDKKRAGNRLHVVLLEAIGRAVIEEISLEDLRTVAEALVAEAL